jgi:hypothetical protein
MTKVKCAQCGAFILEGTAAETGGFCMPCKTGRRGSINQAKLRAQEKWESKSDPLVRLWRDLVWRAHHTQGGFDGLSEPEKQFYAVGTLDGDVCNGGFSQYFFNSSASHYDYAVAGLTEMGAAQACALLQRAKQVLFDFQDVPKETAERRSLLAKIASQSRDERLQQLDELYWQDDDRLRSRSAAFASKNGLV